MTKTISFLLFFMTCLRLSAQINRDSILKAVAGKSDSVSIERIFDLSDDYLSDKPDSAYLLALHGQQLSKKIHNVRGEARALFIMGKVFKQKGNYPDALRNYDESQSLFESIHDLVGVAGNTLFIGEVHAYQGDCQLALTYYHRAKAIYDQLRNDYATALTLLKIGDCYESQHRLDSAANSLKQIGSRERDKSAIEALEGRIYLSFGNIYSQQDSLNQAMIFYRKSIPALLKVKGDRSICQVRLRMAELFQRLGQEDSCLAYASQSLSQARRAGFMLEVLEAASFLTDYFKGRQRYDSAFIYLQTSIVARDSLFSSEKTAAIQDLLFKDKLKKQEDEARRQQEQSQQNIAILLSIIGVFLVIGFLLWRNNKQKQKANLLLTRQKLEVQTTLAELRALQQQLIHAEKMASLGEVTAGIAHEIQNPLNFITNFSELSAELLTEVKENLRSGQNEQALETVDDLIVNLDRISQHGRRADAIVKNMLQHSRKSTGVKEETDINQLADEFLRLSYESVRAQDKSFSASLETHFDSQIARVQMIPQDMGRVLLNLFNNAFYSVAEKKKAEANGYQPVVQVITRKINDAFEIRVKDNGLGIPEKVVDKIYQPFFTTKPAGQGTGLGLSLSYDIVTKVHGGKMKVNTKQGEYAEFIIELPYQS